jgi:hypothetical protein
MDKLCTAGASVVTADEDDASTVDGSDTDFLSRRDTTSDVSELFEDCSPNCDGPVVAKEEVFGAKETLLIFDWDDTLFPTTWAEQQGFLLDGSDVSTAELAKLQAIEDCTIRILRAAKQKGRVVIVTNAMKGWVEHCCTQFMPLVIAELRDISVVSARSMYEHCDGPTEWKCLAFAREVSLFYASGDASQRRNVISLGDSLHERRALACVTQCVPNCWAKSVKFVERPSPEQLIEQHELVNDNFQYVVECVNNLDLEVGNEGQA